MRVEIDQSGKVEQLDTHTVVSFSNGTSGSIYCSASAKRIIYQAFPKSLIPRENLNAIFFAVLIYLLIKDKIIDSLVVDEEYTRKDHIIRGKLTELFIENNKKIPVINFGLVGKLSPAHRLAWLVHKKKLKNKSLATTEREIISLILGNKKSRDHRPHSPLLRRGSAHHSTLKALYHKKSR